MKVYWILFAVFVAALAQKAEKRGKSSPSLTSEGKKVPSPASVAKTITKLLGKPGKTSSNLIKKKKAQAPGPIAAPPPKQEKSAKPSPRLTNEKKNVLAPAPVVAPLSKPEKPKKPPLSLTNEKKKEQSSVLASSKQEGKPEKPSPNPTSEKKKVPASAPLASVPKLEKSKKPSPSLTNEKKKVPAPVPILAPSPKQEKNEISSPSLTNEKKKESAPVSDSESKVHHKGILPWPLPHSSHPVLSHGPYLHGPSLDSKPHEPGNEPPHVVRLENGPPPQPEQHKPLIGLYDEHHAGPFGRRKHVVHHHVFLHSGQAAKKSDHAPIQAPRGAEAPDLRTSLQNLLHDDLRPGHRLHPYKCHTEYRPGTNMMESVMGVDLSRCRIDFCGYHGRRMHKYFTTITCKLLRKQIVRVVHSLVTIEMKNKK